ncbi:MAG: leucine-rich repeat domain-containing protein [Proteobacteria bacterium]|nr:MAG: leucine-rich repeat domain-containing protein [Pseudomonadota bacterium]
MRKPYLRFLSLSVFVSLILSCDGRPSKHKPSVPSPVLPPVIGLLQNCGDEFLDGQTRSVTLYRSEFAPVGKKCEQTKFETEETCTAGQRIAVEPGTDACQETSIKGLKIVSPVTSLEVGESLALVLEGTDNRDGKVTLDNKTAKWTTSNDFVTVSTSGVVSGTLTAKNVTITAKFEKLTATVKLNLVGKSCGDTLDGEKVTAKRYKSERVAFGATCATVDTMATCENGVLAFVPASFESCEAAKLTRLEAMPTTLYLNRGETAPVRLTLIDDIGSKIAVAAASATWEVPAGITQNAGRLTATQDPREGLEVKVSAEGMTTTILVQNPEFKPELIGFKENNLVLKVGDERVLEARTNQPIDASRLNWGTSDATAVSVDGGKIKALKAGSVATITARLDDKFIQAKVTVEDGITWDIKPVIYDENQTNVKVLTQDKAFLNPAYVMTVTGPTKPVLTGATEGCTFEARESRGKWEINAALDETRDVIPNKCEVDVTAETPAGQKLTEKLSIVVDYNKTTVVESLPKETAEGVEVATVKLRMSSSYAVESAVMKGLTEDALPGCEWNLLPVDTGYRVLVKRTDSSTCAGQLILKMKDANDGLILTTNELIVASDSRPFQDMCANPDNDGVKATLAAIRQVVSQTLTCEKLAAKFRADSLASLLRAERNVKYVEGSGFSLALDNRKLTDLTILARLVGLNELSLGNNRSLSNIEPLRNLKQLKILDVKFFTAIKDFAPIYSHAGLYDLRLPKDVSITCNADIKNPTIIKVCKQ